MELKTNAFELTCGDAVVHIIEDHLSNRLRAHIELRAKLFEGGCMGTTIKCFGGKLTGPKSGPKCLAQLPWRYASQMSSVRAEDRMRCATLIWSVMTTHYVRQSPVGGESLPKALHTVLEGLSPREAQLCPAGSTKPAGQGSA